MKKTFGKIGFGLAGAVAAVGLMSAGVRSANAEIVLTTASPTEGVGAMVNGKQTYNFIYSLELAATGTILDTSTHPAYFSLNLGGANADLALVPTFTLQDTAITTAGGSFTAPANNTLDGNTYTWNYSGTTYTSTTNDETLGYITVASYSPNAYSPASLSPDTYASQANKSTGLPDTNNEGVNGPSLIGTPLAPLPLPAAFWPGLMTLGGMAVVGGLRLRRRAV